MQIEFGLDNVGKICVTVIATAVIGGITYLTKKAMDKV